MDQKGEQMFALRRNAPGCIARIGAGAGNAAGRAEISKKKKKKNTSPFIIP